MGKEDDSIDILRLVARWAVLEPPTPWPPDRGALLLDTSLLELVMVEEVEGLAPSLAFNCGIRERIRIVSRQLAHHYCILIMLNILTRRECCHTNKL